MSFFVPLPSLDGAHDVGYLDIVDGKSTAVQRALRRSGLAAYEPPTIATFLTLAELQAPGFNFFDVGSNIGLYATLCASLFDPAKVVAFEPTPETARVARKISRVNQLGIQLEELALGRQAGTAELYLSAKSDASNSLVEGFKENVGTVQVEVKRLDDYVSESRTVPSIIKIDAETFEPEILAGAVRTLAKHQPYIIVEVLHRKGHDHGVEVMEALDQLDYRYYEISTYSEWVASDALTGDPTGEQRDWLLAPGPLPDDFGERFERWEAALAECTSERNSSTRPDPAPTHGSGDGLRSAVAKLRRRVARLIS